MTLSALEIEEIEEKLKKKDVLSLNGNPLVSVIIPSYNAEKYFERCLTSLINQTLKDIEIIIIDDGSLDDTKKIVEIFKKYDNRIFLIEGEHKLQGAARNKGIEKARGEYIGFVDSDDWVDLNYFESLYNSAKKYDSDLALGINIRVGNGKSKKRINIEKEEIIKDLQKKFDVCKIWKDGCPTNKIYKKDFLNSFDIRYPEGMYCEDKLFTIKSVYFANSIVTVPDIYYYYFRNPKSTVKNRIKEKKRKEDKNNARLDVLNFLKDSNAKVRDKDFWAITKKISMFGIPIFTKKESLNTAKYYLFSFIKVYEGRI